MRLAGIAVLAASAGGVMVAFLPSAGAFVLSGGFILLVIAAIVVGRPRVVALLTYAMLGLLLVDVSPVTAGGSTVRLYQPLTAVLVATVLLRWPGPRRVVLGPLFMWLAVFTVLVGASYMWTTSPGDTAVVAIGQMFLLTLLALVSLLLSQRLITVEGILTALWAGALLSSAVAVCQFVLGLGGSDWGLQYVPGVPWGRPAGLMTEPDWGALVGAVGLIVTVTARKSGSALYRTSMAIFGLTVAVTLVRAVLLALGAVLIVALLIRGQGALRRQLYWMTPAVVLAVAVVTQVYPAAFARLNLLELFEARNDGGALNSRLGVVALIQERGPDRPWLGHGAGSLARETSLSQNLQRYAGGGELNAGRGSTNLFLTSFWDLGWIGVFVVATVVSVWLWCAYRGRDQHPALLPLAVLLVVDFQANNGLRFGFVWVIMAVTSYVAGSAGNSPRLPALPVSATR